MQCDDTGPETVEAAIDGIIERLDDIHDAHVQTAELAGYARDCFKSVRPYWVTISKQEPVDPQNIIIVEDALAFLEAYGLLISETPTMAESTVADLHAAAGSAATFVSTSAVYSSITQTGPEVQHLPMPIFFEEGQTSLCNRLGRIDPALGNTCREIQQALYGTRADPERAAMFQMRQCFDHFFGHLAPDDDVRESEFWQPKEGDNPNAVSHWERIRYAAATHVANPERAAVLVASTKPVLRVYKKLNRIHKHGQLNPEDARKALCSMQLMLTEWADALGL